MARRPIVLLASFAIIATIGLCRPVPVLATPLTITKVQDLSFGRFVRGAGSGTVVVDAAGTRHATGSVTLLSGSSTAASFTIRGNAGATYTITLPATVTIASGGNQMTVGTLTSSISTSGVLPAGGSLTFSVGGTLTASAAQASGTYSGPFTVTLGK